MMKERKTVITGIGPLTSAGAGKDVLWTSLAAGKTGLAKEEFRLDGQRWDSFLYHKVPDFDIRRCGIDQPVLDDIVSWLNGKEDRDLFYLLAAVKLALDDSALGYDRRENTVGLFLTVEHPGFEKFIADLCSSALAEAGKKRTQTELFQYLYETFVQNGYNLQTFMYLFLVAKAFGLHGFSLFTSNACASGLYTLDAAAEKIRSGACDAAVVAGGDWPGTLFKHKWFSDRKLYAEDGKMKPFAANSDGIVFGDGASAIVLEELGRAKERGAHIYAEYAGGGFSLEGWKVVVPQPGSDSYHKAVLGALKASGVKGDRIDLVNPHGVGIKITDIYEAKAITDTVGEKTPVTAFKPYIGHNLGGSAIAEIIILLLCMENSTVLPTLNCGVTEPRCRINLVKAPLKKTIKTALKMSCGFAGYNGACVFKKP